jgi:protein kinase A
LSQFDQQHVLGVGHFGKVILARYLGQTRAELQNNELYALKICKVSKQIKSKQISHLYNEKNSLKQVKGNRMFT